MPASSSRFASGWRTLGLAVALPASLAVFSPATFAADVVVITDSRHPVKTMGGERLIELDEGPRIEAELSAQLPIDPEQATAIVRAKVEHPFRVVKQQFGYAKVRYRGLAKNTARLTMLFALSNLWMARRHVLGAQA